MSIYDINGSVVASDSSADIIITGVLPTIFITSDTAYADVTKASNSYGTFTFVDTNAKIKEIPIKFKLQGSGALSYDKHNFNITFYTDTTYGTKQKYQFNSWMPVSKIHLKANEYDYSMCRNSAGAIITHHLMGKNLPNGARGYIDSFPCILYYNDTYVGCHTVNLPQDGKTYNFTDEAEVAGTNLAYRCDTTSDWDVGSNWEYRGDENETTDMRAVFTALHTIMANYSNLTRSIVEAHFDVESLLGYYVLADIMYAIDSLTNNWTIATWDGTLWYHTWYDLDIIFGLGGSGTSRLVSPTSDITACGQYNEFWGQIYSLYSSEIASMYARFRDGGCNADYIYGVLSSFQEAWGWQNIAKDREVWADDKPNATDIDYTWIVERLEYLDTKYGYSS